MRTTLVLILDCCISGKAVGALDNAVAVNLAHAAVLRFIVLLVCTSLVSGICPYQSYSSPTQRGPIRVLVGHTDVATSVVFTPNGDHPG